ncbi:A-kinase anchor protein 6 isoform X2 [Electrophorus electricus]|uniref:A-kinase anchor protein 6 isoform X2 n=1 Tax=Electrophorus electricus TaxID=8005 RepID=UPI0015CFE4C6|nr:A-kinase anchor protein 6 isoform X2 [Electrophorus electricus]
MSIVVSPVASEAASPMITSVTPTLELSLDEEQHRGGGSGEDRGPDHQCSYQKPPPLHTGADWKVVLHLPEIETWLRATADRVRDLTHSVQQDSLNKHVDVHLVQLKDICEDISDHVEQIHALLETEFSLKLLSYSVNIIVDIRSVQLLWHQLRVSVLVLKERLLQSLQDSNGNYTRHTDILQAFSQDHDQARLDSLTEVDDSGQLTIKCSRDYFSLDCGITAYELSDYSPGEEQEDKETTQDPHTLYPEPECDFPELPCGVDVITTAASEQNQESSPPAEEPDASARGSVEPCSGSALTAEPMQGSRAWAEGSPGLTKCPVQGTCSGTPSPTQPSLPKKPMFASPAALPYQADISRSTPSLLDLPDRSKFWLELESMYPSNGSQSDENLHLMNRKNLQANEQKPPDARISLYRSSSEASQERGAAYPDPQPGLKATRPDAMQATGDSSSPVPSSEEDISDLEARRGSSSPDNQPLPREVSLTSQPTRSPRGECWYGSEEFLALPAQLRQTELLALKLESLAKCLPPRALDQPPIQDVDDWELTEASSEWEGSPHPLPTQSYRKGPTGGRFSSSSSEVAASLDGSIESGPLSDLPSEDEGGWSSSECQRMAQRAGQPETCTMVQLCTPLIQQLLEDIQHQENYQDVWGKIEVFVSKLDEFICWLREALETTENWTPPRADAASLYRYLETHLAQVQRCHGESQRDTVDQMRVRLQSQQYRCGSRGNTGNFLMSTFNSLSEFETEYQELWDWLMDMESTVMDSHELMMSEEQRRHLCKGNRVEMTMWLPKKMQLLGWAESLKRSGTELPADFEERINALRSKWEELEKTLGDCVEQGQGAAGAYGLLSPGTSSMVSQLERKVKELKTWLRDTELLIFNVNLRADVPHPNRARESHSTQRDHPQNLRREPGPHPEPNPQPGPESDPEPDPEHDARSDRPAAEQVENFKALCREVRARRKGMASVLRLCQHLLDGPRDQSSESERQSLQLLQVNLERRWEAIITQTLHWRSRLQCSLGREQVPESLIDPSLIDLRGPSEDSWEWDEIDMTIVHAESQDEASPPSEMRLEHGSGRLNLAESSPTPLAAGTEVPESSRVYQVFCLHEVELLPHPQCDPNIERSKGKQALLKRPSKDSSFSSAESLPDVVAGLLSGRAGQVREASGRSESESGIVSEGDTETTGNSEACLLYQSDDGSFQASFAPNAKEQSPCADRVSDEDIDRILERAKKCAELESCVAEETKDQRYHLVRRRREECGERWRKSRKEPLTAVNGYCFSPENQDERAGADDGRKALPEHAQPSRGSSLDSLCAAGELFPSAKDALTRSTSLESWQAPQESPEEAGNQGCTGALAVASEPSAELSGRTLELLKRLENIRSPLEHKLTRSISDISLLGGSLRPPPGHVLRAGGAPPSTDQSLAASLTELSSIGDSSMASEDLAVRRNRRAAPSSERKQGRGRQPPDETEASVSMVVNVSCTSACTDDEDDSDLLSSSTLTLTEEELGIKDEEDSSVSSEEYMESSFALGLDYMKGEFQGWRTPRSQNRDKNEGDLGDELQCGALSRESPSPRSGGGEQPFLNRAALRLLEADRHAQNGGPGTQGPVHGRADATRSYISRFVDDVENGNVESSHVREKDEDDDQLLREEGSLFTKTGESLKDHYGADALNADARGLAMAASPSPCEPVGSRSKESTLEGQLQGELPCHSSRRLSLSPYPPDESSAPHRGPPTSFLTDVREGCRQSPQACCSRCSPPAEEEKGDDVHAFVMEIVDMTSVTRKTKEAETEPPREASCPASVSQIREKVLEHSRRPIRLRKGDFYSYLSLSSHDSDCGEVVARPDKSSTPVLSRTPEIHDEEPLFEVCTEEVYLGPPLCYSMSISRRPTRRSTKLIDPFCPPSQAPPPACDEYQKAHGISPGSVAGSQPQSHNEAPYLNPLPCETLIDTVECFADTKMLESNISPVMTKIRVSCSSTNPLKGEGSLYINPKINCPPIRKRDRDERGAASQWMKQKNVRKGHSSHQEAKATHKQVSGSQSGGRLVEAGGHRAPPPAHRTDSSSAVRSGEKSRPQARVPTRVSGSLAGTSRN